MKKEVKEKIIMGTLGGILVGTIAGGIVQIVLINKMKKRIEEIEQSLISVLDSNNKINEIGLEQTDILQEKLIDIIREIRKIDLELEVVKNRDEAYFDKVNNELEKHKQIILINLKDLKNNLRRNNYHPKGGKNGNGNGTTI